MKNKNEILSELEIISKILYDIKKKDAQKDDVPDNYFENLEHNIFSKINPKIVKERSIFSYLKPIALAASIVGVLVFSIIKFYTINKPYADCNETLACLSQSEIQAYVADNIQEFESEEIYHVFESSLTNDVANNTEQISEMEEDAVHTYIEENPTTINDLINEENNYIF